jgi:transglutaminase-like putative cysteine protease
MRRTVGVTLEATVESPARLAIQVAVADGYADALRPKEDINVTLDGRSALWTPVEAPHRGRLWVMDTPPGRLRIEYRADVEGDDPPPPVEVSDELLYLRPSRYCESDRLVGIAARLFHDINRPDDLLAAVSSWVGTQLEYVPGSSGPTDGAVDTLLTARGVCRDYAHLAIALLRAMDVPARLVAVYAPGLEPMDFHAVAEGYVNGSWYVVDSTLLAPRSSMVRIATGRDAADTAFLSNCGGDVTLENLNVTAIVDGELPSDDVNDLVQLGGASCPSCNSDGRGVPPPR